MAITRRRFLARGMAAAAVVAAGVYGGWKWRRGDPADIVVAVLKRRVGYLNVDPASFRSFAADYLLEKKEYLAELRKLSAVSLPLRFFTPYRWMKQGNAVRRLEDTVVGQYLLSTDFFEHGGDELRAVNYVTYYDPYRAPCRNFLARRTRPN
jgi:hypothetical protein